VKLRNGILNTCRT